MKRQWRSFKLMVERWIDQAWSLLTIISYLLLFILTFILLSFASTHIALSSQQLPHPFYKSVTDFALRVLLIDSVSLSPSQYSSTLSTMLNIAIVIISVWFAVIPYWAYSRLTKQRNIRIFPVYSEGIDDLKLMLDYYRGAEKVIVFSGDFSWIKDHEELKQEINKLAHDHKIALLSYKDEITIRSVLGHQLFDALKSCFTFDTGRELKCSFVKYTGTSVFLYRFQSQGIAGRTTSVGVLTESTHSRYLLQALEVLCSKH